MPVLVLRFFPCFSFLNLDPAPFQKPNPKSACRPFGCVPVSDSDKSTSTRPPGARNGLSATAALRPLPRAAYEEVRRAPGHAPILKTQALDVNRPSASRLAVRAIFVAWKRRERCQLYPRTATSSVRDLTSSFIRSASASSSPADSTW